MHEQLCRYHFPVIDSTNTWAKANAHLLPHDRVTLITASIQTAGRGRLPGRCWYSPGHQNFLGTFFFTVPAGRRDVANIPQVLALSIAQILDRRGVKVRFKWPNDLYIRDKKLAGILTETVVLNKHLGVVVGIGLNINMPLEHLQKIEKPATSILVETGESWEVSQLTYQIQKQFLADLHRFLRTGFSLFQPKLEALSAFAKGQMLRFNDDTHVWDAEYHSLHTDGSLNLVVNAGEIRSFCTGEIIS